jgi:hypothetical protein
LPRPTYHGAWKAYFAVLLNAKFMPTLKGLDRLTRAQRREAVERYAQRLAEHLLTNNLKPYSGPPAAPHTPSTT